MTTSISPMRCARSGLTAAIGALATLTSAAAQEGGSFDRERAYVAEEQVFVPFLVEDRDFVSLEGALEDGTLQPDTWLVVMEHEAGTIGLVMDQIAYHHIAQGEIAGEPWMVSF